MPMKNPSTGEGTVADSGLVGTDVHQHPPLAEPPRTGQVGGPIDLRRDPEEGFGTSGGPKSIS